MKNYLFIFCFLVASSLSAQYQPCHIQIDSVTINGQAFPCPDTITLCQGSSLTFSASAYCTDTLFSSNFNGSNPGVGWYSNCSPVITNPCGPGPDGSTYVWVGPAADFPREMACGPFALSGYTEIHFDMKYASQADGSPCEGPDESTEGVHMQVSNNGSTWYDLGYWDPNGGFDPILTSWRQYTCSLNYVGNVAFRWFQTNTSGNDYDHWGIDNVIITQHNASIQTNLFWTDDTGIFSNDTMITVNPLQNTLYTINLDGGTFLLQDSVFVQILDTTLSIIGLDTLYYTNSPPVLIIGDPQPGYFTGPGISNPNVFSPLQAGIGIHEITWHHYLIGNAPLPGSVTVFNENFSNDMGWSGYGSGGWERGFAMPSTGCSGSQDPNEDHSSSNDNFLIGTYIGACYPNSLDTTFWLTSPVINCTGMTGCNLEFWSYSGCESASFDKLSIEVLGGSVWTNIYTNTGSFSETNWTYRAYPIPQADDQNAVQLRFGIGPTDGSVAYQGWNIDDIKVICNGSIPTTDTLCELSYTQQVNVMLPTSSAFYQNETGIQIYPNPANEMLNISIRPDSDKDARIRDLYGRNILSIRLTETDNAISLQGIPAGLYILETGSEKIFFVKE